MNNMKFNSLINSLINSLLKEEELSDRKKIIEALKSINDVRTLHVDYQGYERHGYGPVEKYVVTGTTLYDALQKLPKGVFDDVFNLSENDLKSLELDEEALKEYLNEIDLGGWPLLSVYENEELLCGITEEDE